MPRACTRTRSSPRTACCATAATGNIWTAATRTCCTRTARTCSGPCMTLPTEDQSLPLEPIESGYPDMDARSLRELRKWPIESGIAGVDEAGCGPLAGPVVVAAVILDPARRINGLDDSKLLPEAIREKLCARIVERAVALSVVAVEVPEIDRINIYHARMAGMLRAITALSRTPGFALIDGNRLPRHLPCRGRAIVDGDAIVPSISAASIIAKVTRDRIMCELDAL